MDNDASLRAQVLAALEAVTPPAPWLPRLIADRVRDRRRERPALLLASRMALAVVTVLFGLIVGLGAPALLLSSHRSAPGTHPQPDARPLPNSTATPAPRVMKHVAGFVRDDMGRALAGAEIMVSPKPGVVSATTDSQGAYSVSFEDLGAAGFWVRAHKVGYEDSQRVPGFLDENPRYIWPLPETTTLDFRMHPVLKVPSGSVTTLSITFTDPWCDLASTGDEVAPCRIVHIVPASSGTLTVNVAASDAGVVLALYQHDHYTWFRPGGESSPTSLTVTVIAGQEMVVDILMMNYATTAHGPPAPGVHMIRVSSQVNP
ncbi:MAG: hypothetical protein NVS1B3_13240 [Candidatus Dormibacteraceae bacterium]